MCVTSPQKPEDCIFDAIITFDDQTAVFMLLAKSSEISLKCDTVNNRH